jgi:hypothetical protein
MEVKFCMEIETLSYFYEELIISLVVLSLSGERQCEITGVGCVGDEILIDFETYYSNVKKEYIEYNFFNLDEIKILDDFDTYLKKFDNLDDDFYWDRDQIKNHPLWEELRVEAKSLINILFDVSYDVIIERDTKSLDGKFIEYTRRKLVEIKKNKSQ